MVKKQHYVSQGILKSFCDTDGKLHEALVTSGKKYRTNTLNAMCEKYIYEHDEVEANAIEKAFATLEGTIIPRLDILIDDVTTADHTQEELGSIQDEVHRLLPSLLIFYYRSNALLTEYAFGDDKFRIPLMLNKIYNHDYIFRLADLIKNNYSFCILKASNSFLISDQYISTSALKVKSVFVDISNRHIGLKDTILLIPLSKQYYIAFWHSTDKHPFTPDKINSLTDAQTFQVNKAIINNSYTKCCGSDAAVLENLLPHWSHQSPSQIFIGHSDNSSSGFTKKKELFFNDEDQVLYDFLTNHVGLIDYTKAKGHDACPCGSKKLFKNCHKKYLKRAKPIYNQYGKRGYIGDITVDGTNNLEQPIDAWGPMSRPY